MASKDNLYFHSAEVYIKRTAANPTPRRIAIIQDVSIEIKRDIKELFGENKYAEDAASGNESISGKYKSGELDPGWMMEEFMTSARTTGSIILVKRELGTVASGTVTVDGAANFREDYGVVDPLTDRPLRRVASAPAVGEYSVNEATGVYTFNNAANDDDFLFTYLTDSTSGETYTVNNTLAGDSVFCSLLLYKTSRTGKPFGLRLANATFESASFGFKLNEHAMPEGSFKGFSGDDGKVFEMFRG